MTIKDLKEKNLIGYEYVRGSTLYGTATENSDIDIGGVFICPQEDLYGLRGKYIEQVSDKKSDVVYYEFGRWIELLLKSNPTALESLFVPKEFVLGDIHPAVQKIIDNRDLFISKQCFNSFYGMAKSQIIKCRGLNKKITNPITERKTVLDFCYTPYEQGSKKIIDWLNDYGLKQKYCGLVALPNMHDTYGLYYDWVAHFVNEYGLNVNSKESLIKVGRAIFDSDITEIVNFRKGMDKFKNAFDHLNGGWYFLVEEIVKGKIFNYTGIVNEDGTSDDVHVCTVPKNEKYLTVISFNKEGYQSHCRDYKEYKEWEKNRNPIRYQSNLDKNYDAKNVSHSMRIIRMAKELAQGKGLNVVRTEDREYLLDIKNHKFEYEDIMASLEHEMKEVDEAIKTCTLPETPDYNKINNLLIEIRKELYSGKM